MNALSIVMTSVASALAVTAIFVIAVLVIMKKVLKAKVSDYEVLNKYAPEKPVVFLGDSLTDFYPVQEFFHDDSIINRGIANETTDDIMKRIDDILSLKPKAVFLQAGINDFVHSYNKAKPDVVANKIMKLADKLREAADEVYIISLYPINNKRRSFSRFYIKKSINRSVIMTNSLLVNRCDQAGYTYIDVHSKLIDSKGFLEESLTVEGLHLTFKGYEIVTAALDKYVKKVM